MGNGIYAHALAFAMLLTAAPTDIEMLSENDVLIGLYINGSYMHIAASDRDHQGLNTHGEHDHEACADQIRNE